MGLAGVCEPCGAFRYCGIPDPTCKLCQGSGLIVSGDIPGVHAIVVLRAALMALEHGIDRAKLYEAHLLADTPTATFAGTLPYGGQAATYGRQASALLVELGLRKPSTKAKMTPEQRAERKRATAAARERDRLFSEKMDRDRQERANERRRQEVEARAARAIADAHPAEYEHEREAQEVFVALEEGFGSYQPPAMRRLMARQAGNQ